MYELLVNIRGGFLGLLLKRKIKIDFAIIGFPKSGTTSIHKSLLNESSIMMPDREAQIKQLLKGELSLSRDNVSVTGIKNPNLIYEIHNLKALYNANQDIKVIIGLRDPTEWLYSFFQYRKMELRDNVKWLRKKRHVDEAKQAIDIDFTEFVRNDLDILGVNINKGIYLSYIRNILDIFKSENIYVYILEEMAINPSLIYSQIYKFLDVQSDIRSPLVTANRNYKRYENKKDYRETFQYLDNFYAPYNEKLNLLLKERWGIVNQYW